MRLIFPYILFTCFCAALYLSFLYYKKEERKYPENHLFSLMCFFSAIWSLGFWGVNIQTNAEYAYFFRAIGMIGIFSYLICTQVLICQLVETKKSYLYPISGVSLFGFIICYCIIQKNQVTYQLTKIGMTYRFNPGFWNTVYVIYIIFVTMNTLASILYMLLHASRKRMRVMAKKLLLAELLLIFGLLFDTLLPLLGKPAIPVSAIGQFLCVLAMYQAIRFLNRSRININNMSTYVYYSLNTPILVYDHNYKLQILNDVAFDFIGLKESETETVHIGSIFSVNEEEVFQFHGKQKDIDVLCYYNQLRCNLSINKIHDDYYDVIGYIITVTDLSERVDYISKLEQAIDEAKNANQAKTTFLANMSHEIRTPMNAIIGFTELILKKDISKEVKEYVEGIHLSSRNLLAIINDILDITKIESGKMELIPDNYFIADLLDDVSLIISQQAKTKGLIFEMKTDDHLPTQLYGDKVRIRGILINILNNAVKYTKEGTVSFEIHIVSQTENSVILAFIIRDTGIGIKPEDQENMFKSFERLDQQVHYGIEGSGLGLAIAKGYTSLMNGEIKVDSVYGEGSVFTITLEQKVIDSTPLDYCFTIDKLAQDTSDNNVQLLIHDVRVLLVDDNHINLSVAKALLSSYGLIVDTASSGEDAITMCQNMHYSIVFMDQMMPEVDGIEAMQQIRASDAFYAPGGEGKIIVLTADAIRGARESLLAKGFDEYLGKPMNLRQLERLLVFYLPKDKITMSVKQSQDTQHSDSSTKYGSFDQSDIKYLQNALPDLDISFGLETSGGTTSDYLNVLKINYTYGYKNLEELENLLNGQDYENYTIKIHAMKSTTKGMGAMTVSDMALAQENAGKAGEYHFIDTHFNEFKTAYLKLIEEVEAVLRHYHMLEETDSNTDDNKEEITSQMISNLLSMIQKHLDAFAFSEIFEILEDMKKYHIPSEFRELFSQLEVLMNDLKIDEAKQLVADYLLSNL